MPFCPNCGKEVSDADEYCSHCRQPLNKNVSVRRIRQKDEKQEKDEKEEKHEDQTAGAIMGGLIIIWLGLTFFFQNYGYYTWFNFGGFFLLGLGVILILRGVWVYIQSNIFDQASGYLIGGVLITLIGANNLWQIENWWAFFLIIIGLTIIIRTITERSRNPRP
jgi:hypothetical protein